MVKKGYKQTEIGVIPEDWEVKHLGDCLSSKPMYGINAASVAYSDRLPLYIRITDISDSGQFISTNRTSVSNVNSEKYYLDKDDIVLARTGASTGKSFLNLGEHGKLVFAGFLIRVKPNQELLLSSFLKGYISTNTYWKWVKLTSMRSGQPGINGNEYAQLPIPLPSLSEQTAIATVLFDTDALIEHFDNLIAKKKAIKQGTMQQLLTGKKRLQGFSGKWEKKKLGDIFQFSVTYSKTKFIDNTGKYIIMDMGSVSSTGSIIASKTSAMELDLLNSGDLIMPKDDIGGGKIIGKVAYIDRDNKYIMGDHVYKLSIKIDLTDSRFFSYLINCSDISNALKKKVVGSAQLGLGRKSVEDQIVTYPTMSQEQTAIATILSDMDTEIEKLEKKREKYTMIKQGMMQQLLTGKIRLI
jgi:type I restriction enzyme S subunit